MTLKKNYYSYGKRIRKWCKWTNIIFLIRENIYSSILSLFLPFDPGVLQHYIRLQPEITQCDEMESGTIIQLYHTVCPRSHDPVYITTFFDIQHNILSMSYKINYNIYTVLPPPKPIGFYQHIKFSLCYHSKFHLFHNNIKFYSFYL